MASGMSDASTGSGTGTRSRAVSGVTERPMDPLDLGEYNLTQSLLDV